MNNLNIKEEIVIEDGKEITCIIKDKTKKILF